MTAIAVSDTAAARTLCHVADCYRSAGREADIILTAFDLEPNRSAVEEEYAARLGKSVKTLYRLYYLWRKHGILGVLPKRALRSRNSRLPKEFVEWFQKTHESFTTDSVPLARRALLQRLQAGERIPGLGTWHDLWQERYPGVPFPAGCGREYPRNDVEKLLPAGLSARSLHRHRSELFDRRSARQGNFAASSLAPMVFTTRVGIKVGQHLIFDDVWHNQNVNWPGASRAVRPIELCCLDALSAHKVAWGARPRLWNPETQRNEGIKDHEFRFMLAFSLCEAVGYRRDGTTLWTERGTAAIDDDLADDLKVFSAGAIVVKRAPLKNARQLCSIYRSAGSGNPRFKARLESHHSASHGELSAIVGQVGRSAELQPEEIYGRDKANDLLLKLQSVLPPELAALLELPYLTWDEYMECVAAAYESLAWHPWHKLEGWEACRFYVKEFRLPPATDWVPMTAIGDMHPDLAAGISATLRDHPENCRVRPLSRAEAWEAGRRDMVLLPKCCMPRIMGPKNGIVRPCPNEATIRFESRLLGPLPHLYGREYVDADGLPHVMRAGELYLFHINPFSAKRELLVSSPTGKYLGHTARIPVPTMGDQDAVMERIKAKTAEWRNMARRVQGRHLNELARQAAAMARNTALVGAAVDVGLVPSSAVMDRRESSPQHSDADDAIGELYGKPA